MTPTPDQLVDSLERQQKASALMAVFEDYVIELEADILKGLVGQYQIGTLTDIHMRGAIGGIAALRSLLKRIDRELEVSTKKTSDGFNQ